MEHNITPELMLSEVFGLTPPQFHQALAEKNLSQKNTHAIIIDIRSEEEYKDGHIPLSINVPFQSLDEYFTQRNKSKDENAVLYFSCWAGNTSRIACMIAKHYGFQAKSIEGGANGWHWSNLPFVQ